MIKLIFIFGLAFISYANAADWQQIGSDSTRDTYVDYDYLNNKKTKNNLLKVWQLFDHKKVIAQYAGTPVLSTKVLVEIDCLQREAKMTYIVTYPEKMGGGRQLTASDPGLEKAPIIPDSLYDVFRKTGCPT